MKGLITLGSSRTRMLKRLPQDEIQMYVNQLTEGGKESSPLREREYSPDFLRS